MGVVEQLTVRSRVNRKCVAQRMGVVEQLTVTADDMHDDDNDSMEYVCNLNLPYQQLVQLRAKSRSAHSMRLLDTSAHSVP